VKAMTLYPIGRITKTRGLSGELIITLLSSKIEIGKNLSEVWLGTDPERLQSWAIDSWRSENDRVYLKLRNVNTRDEADFLKGLNVFVDSENYSGIECLKWINFEVYVTGCQEKLGIVTDLDLFESQPRLLVNIRSKIVMIPIVDAFI
jgi:16S rRNA processing protein RimM